MTHRPLGASGVEWMRPLGLAVLPGGGSHRLLQPSYLPLDEELTVLYGLNGAGKSFVLDGLAACLSGLRHPRQQRSSIYLIGQLPDGDGFNWPIGLANTFAAAVGKQMVVGSEVQELLSEVITVAFNRCWEIGHYDDFAARFDLVEEFSTSGTFLVKAVGLEVPAWEIRPALVPSGATPAATEFLNLLRAHHIDDDFVMQAPVSELWTETHTQPAEAPTLLYSEVYSFTTTTTFGGVRPWDDVISDGDGDVDKETAHAISSVLSRRDHERFVAQLYASMRPDLAPPSDGSDGVTLQSLAEDVQRSANAFYAGLLRDAPVLALEIAPLHEWITNAPLRWGVKREPTAELIPVTWLSHAERRWATVAIRLALTQSPRPVLILDEPENALHRAAESYMARGLGRLAKTEARVLVATHSPELLDARDGQRILVRRQTHEQPGGLVTFTGADHDSMEALGLQPSDLLRRTRGFLLVEGEHDVQVLGGMFGSRLTELGVDLLPLRGGGRLKSALDSRFLFDYTEAVLFPLLDDLDAVKVSDAWDTATRKAKVASRDVAVDGLRQALASLPGKGREFLEPFLTRALILGRESRVVPLGIRGTDILEYLPVELLVPGASSWDDLRAQLKRDRGGTDPTETDFKLWLGGRHSADLSPGRIRSVAEECDPHPELAALVDQISQVLAESS